jgi:hypothetical protein
VEAIKSLALTSARIDPALAEALEAGNTKQALQVLEDRLSADEGML